VLISKSKQAKLSSTGYLLTHTHWLTHSLTYSLTHLLTHTDIDNKDDVAPISHDTNSRGAGGVKSRTIQSYFAPQGQDATAASSSSSTASSMSLLARSESLNTGSDRVSGESNTSPAAKDVKNKSSKPATAKPSAKDTLSSSTSSIALSNAAEMELKKQLQQLKILKEQGILTHSLTYLLTHSLVYSRFEMPPT